MSDAVSLLQPRPPSARDEAFRMALLEVGFPAKGRFALAQTSRTGRRAPGEPMRADENKHPHAAPVVRLKLKIRSQEDNEAIARFIADDDDTVRRVAGMVGRFREALSCTISSSKSYPTRSALGARLRALQLAISTIRESIEDHRLAPVLLGGDAFFDHEYEMLAGLEALKTRAEAVSIRKGKGKDKHYVRPSGLNEQEVCALMIAIAWGEARGSWPPHNNLGAQRACAALWASSGGDGKWVKGSVSAWKWRLEAAKAADDSDEAFQIYALIRRPEGY